MLTIAPSTKIFLAAGVTDMRKSFDTLAAIVEQQLSEDPQSGHVFAFCNRGRNRVKLLVWDRAGFWLFAKRLEKGTFAWPTADTVSIEMSPEELSALLGGLDLAGSKRRLWYTHEKHEQASS